MESEDGFAKFIEQIINIVSALDPAVVGGLLFAILIVFVTSSKLLLYDC